MAVSGGGNRKDLRPLDQSTKSTGSHRRQFEALNVDQQPGFKYRHERWKRSQILSSRSRGWQFVKRDDPEYAGQDDLDIPMEFQQEGLDSIRPFGDVVLMRQPIDLWLEEQNILLERNAAARGSADVGFMEKGRQRAAEAGSAASDRGSLFHKQAIHGTDYVDQEEEEK